MMKHLTLLFLTIIITGCGNPPVDLSSLDALSVDWQQRSAQLNEFDEKLESALITADQLLNKWSLSEEELTQLDQDAKDQYATIRTASLKALAGFTPIQDDLSDFRRIWERKTIVLQSIREQVENDRLDDDPEPTLHQLSGLLSKASDKLEKWQTSYVDASVQLKHTMSALRDFADSQRQ